MSGDTGSINFEVPSGVQSQLDLANQQLQNEYNRLVGLQQALVSGQGAQYQAIGYNPYTQGPIVGQMVGDILAGGQPNFGAYSQPQGAPPTPVPAPQGARPIDYEQEFRQKGYKNWGSNDDVKVRQRTEEQGAWDRQQQQHENYIAQKLAYDKSGLSSGQFEQYRAQAEYQANLLKQAMGTPEQLKAEQGLIKQIGQKIQQAPQLLDMLNQQLQTAVGDMPQFLTQLNAQLGQAIQGSPQWQQQYKVANAALADYQTYANKVLTGEIPFDPLIIQTLRDQSDATQGILMKNLGPGWATSTPAIEAMARNQQLQTAVLESERRKDITNALSNVQGAANIVSGLENQRFANIQNTQGALATQYNQRFQNIFGTQQAAGEQLNQYQQDIVGQLAALQGLQGQRYGAMRQLLGTQGSQQELGTNWASILGGISQQPYQVSYAPLAQLYQQGASVLGQQTVGQVSPGVNWATQVPSLMQGVGSLAGAAVGGLALAYSDMRLKDLMVARYDEDGRETIAGVPTYDFRYAWDPDTRLSGVLAQDAEKVHPEAVQEVGGWKAVDYGKLVQLDRR